MMTRRHSTVDAVIRAHAPGWTYGLAAVLSALALWFWFALDNSRIGKLLPNPWQVIQAGTTIVIEGFAGENFLMNVLASLQRWISGVTAAVVLGVPIGAYSASNQTLNLALRPILEPLRFIPPIAWVPLAVLWFQAGLLTEAFVVFVGAFPPIVINSRLAVRQLSTELNWASQMLGGQSLRTMCSILIPAAAPGIFTGIRIAMGNGWGALVGAELVGARSGLGFLILRAQEVGNIAVVIFGMVVIGLIGFLLDRGIRGLRAVALRWEQ